MRILCSIYQFHPILCYKYYYYNLCNIVFIAQVIKNKVKGIDREWQGKFGSKVAFATWSVVLVVLTAWLTHKFK